jgi:predicted HTH transcriptional regulator
MSRLMPQRPSGRGAVATGAARLTAADQGSKSVRRNALIADLLHRIGFIEKAGTGIKRIRDEARDGGYPEPVWEANGFTTAVF